MGSQKAQDHSHWPGEGVVGRRIGHRGLSTLAVCKSAPKGKKKVGWWISVQQNTSAKCEVYQHLFVDPQNALKVALSLHFGCWGRWDLNWPFS